MKNKLKQTIVHKNKINLTYLWNSNLPAWRYLPLFKLNYTLTVFFKSLNKFTLNKFISKKFIGDKKLTLQRKRLRFWLQAIVLFLKNIYCKIFIKKNVYFSLQNFFFISLYKYYAKRELKNKNIKKKFAIKKFYALTARYVANFFFLKHFVVKTEHVYNLHLFFTFLPFKRFFFSHYRLKLIYALNKNKYKHRKYNKQLLVRKSKFIYLLFLKFKQSLQVSFKNLYQSNIDIFFHNYAQIIRKIKTLQQIQKTLSKNMRILNVLYTRLFPHNLNLLISIFYLNLPELLVSFLAKHFSRIGKSKKRGHSRVLKELVSCIAMLRSISFNLTGLRLFLFGKFNSSRITTNKTLNFGESIKTQILFKKVKHTFMPALTFTGVFGIHLWYYQL